ncbi:MAG: alcohol dehydrogenase catalytic domain-containing protein [Spirochaetales bacterium]|nr:alcohol dehydrogenase catalytic domain-containing protein [Spirochaetales bacterium]
MKNTMMKALVTYAPFDYRYEEAPIPQLTTGEILLAVKGCGICAGDMKTYHGGTGNWGTSEETRYIEVPVIGGHEFYGEIKEIAGDVEGFHIGDVIVAEQILPCGTCEFCRAGTYWMCVESAVFGFKHRCQGGFAEYVKLPKRSIKHKIPSHFSHHQAILVEPLACGMHAVERAQIRHSDVVVVAGLGAIGLAMVNMAAIRLPRLVIGLDINESRIGAAQEHGADVALNPATCDVVEEVQKLTNGRGCDVYIEASGSEKSVQQGIDLLVNHGSFVQMGVFPDDVTANWNIIGDRKELHIIGSHLSALTYRSVIKGISTGLIKTNGLISHEFALQDWKTAFETVEKERDAMKVVLVP